MERQLLLEVKGTGASGRRLDERAERRFLHAVSW